MDFPQGHAYLTEWYNNESGQSVRDFIWRDFDNWLWTVKQFGDNGVVTNNVVHQINRNTGEANKMDITNICTKGIAATSNICGQDFYKELQLTHTSQ
jgi:hypothetical protein